jgi:predicted NUDIX family NTP pyrophosphohydrolase
MRRQSAGLLMYRRRNDCIEVFLVHPGGPFWAKKNLGAWSVPKGEYTDGEPPLQAAVREFHEETGFHPEGNFLELGVVKQAGGKVIAVWSFEGDCDPADLVSNRFQLEWPPRSGRLIEFPEADRGDWFSIPDARKHILKSQEPFLDGLCRQLNLAEEARK